MISGTMRAFGCIVLIALLAAAIPHASAQKNVLVLFSSSSIQDTHSQFFDELKAANFNLHFKSVKDGDLKLREYDTFLYDSLILFAPQASSKYCITVGCAADRVVEPDSNHMMAHCRVWGRC